MRPLELFQDYTRREVHDIFDRGSPFTKGAGSWGNHGILTLPDRPSDFVFFVSYGRKQGDHQFDEGISVDGILRWQSQPKQPLDNPQIQQFISHDDTQNSIYLFLRTRANAKGRQLPYTYLGRLKYRGHDGERQKPVHFSWQLIDWPISTDTTSRMGLQFARSQTPPIKVEADQQPSTRDELVETAAPIQRRVNVESTQKFRAKHRRLPNEEENKALGLRGEELVLMHEKLRLCNVGRSDLAKEVRHTSVEEGDGAGYDIKSFFEDGRTKYIEVKTTAGPVTADFYITTTEVAFSEQNAAQFELKRVYDYDRGTNSARCFSIFGSLSLEFKLTATQYRVSRLVEE